MINVTIDDDDFLGLLMQRLKVWTQNTDVLNLFEQMYQNNIELGIFEGSNLNIMDIVDNDYVNCCTVYYDDDIFINDCKKLKQAIKDNEYDISTIDFDYIGGSYIEAYNNDMTMFLIRY